MKLATHLEHRQRQVDEALERLFPDDKHRPYSLHRAIRYSLVDGGKRIRPLLVLAATEACGGRVETALPFACAIEMIHTYSLIHDDLPAMDDDRLRRGKPTSHIVFGEALAILAGDALLTDAFRVMTDPANTRAVRPKRLVQIVNVIAHAAGVHGMVAGQVADVEAEGREPDLPTVEFIHVRKTGALILAAVRTGALVADAKPSVLRRLAKYGEYLGLAFQIVDDVLDAEGTAEQTGKEVGGDERRKKATYTAVLGVPDARRRAIELGADALKEIEGFGKRANPLREIARLVVGRMTET